MSYLNLRKMFGVILLIIFLSDVIFALSFFFCDYGFLGVVIAIFGVVFPFLANDYLQKTP